MTLELGFIVNKSHKEGNVTVVTDLTLLEVSVVQPMLTLKDHVAGNAEFQYYRAGNLMYRTSTGLEFPIAVTDTNDATFPRTEKGIFFMRWIRKHLADNNLMEIKNIPTKEIGIPNSAVGHLTMQTAREIEEERLLKKYGKNKFTP